MDKETVRQDLIAIVAGVMSAVCDAGHDASHNWSREADKAIGNWLGNEEEKTLRLPEDVVNIVDGWQKLRIAKDTDFPLCGAIG